MFLRSLVVLAAAAIVSAGCNKNSTATPPSPTSTAPPTTAAPGGVAVDLVITGADPAVLKGSKGRCNLFLIDNKFPNSGYEFMAADYPSLGTGGYFSFEGTYKDANFSRPADIYKNQVNGNFLLDAGGPGQGITMSADRKHVTVDADVSRAPVNGNPPYPATGHIKGTIDCA